MMKKGLYFFLCVVVLVAGMCWRSNTRKSITSPTNFFEMQYETLENAHAHFEEIKPNKAKEAMRDHYDLAELSKKLATIISLLNNI